MKTTKNLALISTFTAVLIGGQFALSAVSGIEIVTVLFLSFAYVFGVKRSIFVANAFSVLRCLIFGFFPTIIVLYLIYYNLFAVVVGAIGNKLKHDYSLKNHVILAIVAILLTVCFTLFDNVITPLFYQFDSIATVAYWYASLTAVVPQVVCVAVSTALLFFPLYKVFFKISF